MFLQHLKALIKALEKTLKLPLTAGNGGDNQISHLIQPVPQLVPVITGQQRPLQVPRSRLGIWLQRDLAKQLSQKMTDTPGNPKSLALVSGIGRIIRRINLILSLGYRLRFSSSLGRTFGQAYVLLGRRVVQQRDLAVDLLLQFLPAIYINLVLAQVGSDIGKQAIKLRRLALGGEAGAHQHALKRIALGLPMPLSVFCGLKLLEILFFPGWIR